MFGWNRQTFFFFGSRGHPDHGSTGQNKAWSVLALLYAAARSDAASDSDMRAEEEVTIDSLTIRTRSLFGASQETIDAFMDEYREILKGRNSVRPLIEAACARLPREEGLAEAIFAQCADVVMADREVVGIEDEFLRELADELRLAPGRRRDIVEVMLWKNEMKASA